MYKIKKYIVCENLSAQRYPMVEQLPPLGRVGQNLMFAALQSNDVFSCCKVFYTNGIYNIECCSFAHHGESGTNSCGGIMRNLAKIFKINSRNTAKFFKFCRWMEVAQEIIGRAIPHICLSMIGPGNRDNGRTSRVIEKHGIKG